MVSSIPWVKVIQTKDAKESKVARKGDGLLIPIETLVGLGSNESRMIVSTFRVQGTGI